MRNELRRLHARRRWLLRAQRLGRPGWNVTEFDEVIERIDALELAELGLGWWRKELLFRLRVRHFELTIEWARELLGEAIFGIATAPRPVVDECAHGKLRPGRLCPKCQVVGRRP